MSTRKAACYIAPGSTHLHEQLHSVYLTSNGQASIIMADAQDRKPDEDEEEEELDETVCLDMKNRPRQC